MSENKSLYEQQIKNLLILFYKRQLKISSNNKSKDIFANTMKLYNFNSDLILYFIKLDVFSYYGYYKDYFNIWKLVCKLFNKQTTHTREKEIFFRYSKLINIISEVILEQRGKDRGY